MTSTGEAAKADVAYIDAGKTLRQAGHLMRELGVGALGVRSENGESIHAFIRKMFASADSARTQRLVIDLRAISGSDTRLAVPLIKDIATRERFTKRGALFVVVGDESFSPSQSAARLLQEYANPVFVRQPRG